MRVLVCGGRDFADQARVFMILDRYKITQLCEGGARGADRLAARWAVARGVPHRTYPANWSTYGKAAGHIRNQEMLDDFRPDLVIAFPGGSGTADMKRRAREAGVPVVDFGSHERE